MEFQREGRTLIWNHDGSTSGTVHLSATLPGLGQIVLHTSILMLRAEPYRLAAELVRGQANKLRNIRVEWERDGWRVSDQIESRSREVISHLCHCLHGCNDPSADEKSIATLIEVIRIGEEMAGEYGQWATQERLDLNIPTAVGLGLPASPLERSSILRDAEGLDLLAVPIDWNTIQPDEGDEGWANLDRDVDEAVATGVPVRLGPILDFSLDRLPPNLVPFLHDPQTLVTLLIDTVETVVNRYADRVSQWVVTHRTNSTEILPFSDKEREILTAKLWGRPKRSNLTVDSPSASTSLGVGMRDSQANTSGLSSFSTRYSGTGSPRQPLRRLLSRRTPPRTSPDRRRHHQSAESISPTGEQALDQLSRAVRADGQRRANHPGCPRQAVCRTGDVGYPCREGNHSCPRCQDRRPRKAIRHPPRESVAFSCRSKFSARQSSESSRGMHHRRLPLRAPSVRPHRRDLTCRSSRPIHS